VIHFSDKVFKHFHGLLFLTPQIRHYPLFTTCHYYVNGNRSFLPEAPAPADRLIFFLEGMRWKIDYMIAVLEI
jgi:hypothetical protein